MIELKNICKKFEEKTIFEDVDLCLTEGTVTCFAGHNGCGKSTMLKVISGLIPPTGGAIIAPKSVRFAYVPEKFQAVNMKAGAFLDYMARMDGIYSGTERTKIIRSMAEDFFLTNMLDRQMKTLSKGTLQKIGVIQALISDPDVLVLDEPLSGQDFDSQQVFIRKILEMKKNNKIILLSAHERNLINALSDRVLTIRDSKVIPLDEADSRRYVIRMEGQDIVTGFSGLDTDGGEAVLEVTEQSLSPVIDRLLQEGWHIKSIYESNK